jgi:uncharacterized membrane protein YhiD involved in acid resistance
LYVALVATAITLVALAASDNELMRLFRIPRKATLRITCSSSEAALDDVARAFADARVKFESRDIVALQSDGAAQSVQIVYLIDIPHRRDLSEIVREIGALSCVSKIEANEPFFVP